MTEEEKEKLYQETISFWGHEKQLRMVQEECAELILAISHYLRRPDSTEAVENLIEETADVLIMAEQASRMVGKESVEKVMGYKLKKVSEKLERYKEIRNLEGTDCGC